MAFERSNALRANRHLGLANNLANEGFLIAMKFHALIIVHLLGLFCSDDSSSAPDTPNQSIHDVAEDYERHIIFALRDTDRGITDTSSARKFE